MTTCDITRWVESLHTEAAAIIAEHRDADEAALVASRSRANLRMLIADLLQCADPSIRPDTSGTAAARITTDAPQANATTPADDSAARNYAALAGCTLLAGLHAIDSALTNPDVVALVHAQLEQFNSAMVELVRAGLPTSRDALEERLRATLTPLARVMDALSPTDKQTNVFAAIEPPDDARSVDGMRRRLAALNLDEAGTVAGSTLLDYLHRASAFPELAHQVQPVAEALATLIDLGEASVSAPWLRDADRAAIDQRIRAALTQLASPDNRAEALARVDHTRALAVCFRRITQARTADVDVRDVADALLTATGVRQTTSRARSGSSHRDAQDADAPPVAEIAPSAAGIVMLNAAIDRMIALRSLPDVRLHRDLRETWRERLVQARSAERALINGLPELLASAHPMADPSQASAILAHVDALEDLQRLARVSVWQEAVERVHTRSIENLQQEIRRRMRPLSDAAQRITAADWADRFNDRILPLVPHPFEVPLRAGGPAVLDLCGGRHADVLNALDADRRAFAADLVRNDDAEAPARLALLADLLNALHACAPLFEPPGRAARLNNHPCWELPAPAIERVTAQLRTRLRLASTAAADSNLEALAGHLQQVQKDVPVIRLMLALEAHLASLPADAPDAGGDPSRSAALHELIDAPPLSSRLAAQRLAIEDALNLILKREHALADGRSNDADRLALELDRTIDSLIARLAKHD